jgi:hypothetical protein
MTKNNLIRHFATAILGCLLCAQAYAQHTTEFQFFETAPDNIRNIMQANAKAVFAEINRACEKNSALQLSLDNVTVEANNRIQTMWATSHFYCTKTSVKENVVKSSNGEYVVYKIPVFFEKGDKPETKYQEVKIEFNKDGKISDLTIVVSEHQYKNVITTSVEDTRRILIIKEFLENFRTAYNREDLPYLESVFSNNALIITGKDLIRDGRKITTLTEQSKDKYIAKLRQVFAKNSYVNINFEEITIKQNEGRPDFYYVYLTQEWNSSTYSDKGWLMLTIQFREKENLSPLIWVRAWQPLDSGTPGRRIRGEDIPIKD